MEVSDIVDKTAECFAPDGFLQYAASSFGATWRHDPVQATYALACAETFMRGKSPEGLTSATFAEAETGVGKTIGYLVPLALYCAASGKRGLISTYTRNLCRQIERGDGKIALAAVEAASGVKVSLSVRLGKANFLSPRRIEDLADFHPEAGTSFRNLRSWAVGEQGDGTLSAFLEAYGSLPQGVEHADVTIRQNDDGSDSAPYLAHLAAAKDTDIVVLTHALTICDALSGFRTISGRGDFGAVVFDEADGLRHSGHEYVRHSVSLKKMVETFKIMSEYHVDKGARSKSKKEDFVRNVDEIGNSLRTIASYVPESGYDVVAYPDRTDYYLPEAFFRATYDDDPLNEAFRSFSISLYMATDRIDPVILKMKKAGVPEEEILEFRKVADRIKAFVGPFKQLGGNGVSKHGGSPIYAGASGISWTAQRGAPSLFIRPAKPESVLSEIWEKEGAPDSVLFTSATLSPLREKMPSPDTVPPPEPYPNGYVPEPPRAFRDFRMGVVRSKRKLSVNEDLCTSHVPERHGSATFCLAHPEAPVPYVPSPDGTVPVSSNPEWLDYAAGTIAKAHENGGRTLALTLSYRDAKDLSERLRAIGVHPIEHVQGTLLDNYVEAYKDDPSAVFVTPAAWAGVNFPGMVDHLVITRLPFSPPDNIEQKAVAGYLKWTHASNERAAGTSRYVAVSSAIKKFRQALGRPFRSPDSEAAVWICDARMSLPQEVCDRHGLQNRNKSYGVFLEAVPERFQDALSRASVIHPSIGAEIREALAEQSEECLQMEPPAF